MGCYQIMLCNHCQKTIILFGSNLNNKNVCQQYVMLGSSRLHLFVFMAWPGRAATVRVRVRPRACVCVCVYRVCVLAQTYFRARAPASVTRLLKHTHLGDGARRRTSVCVCVCVAPHRMGARTEPIRSAQIDARTHVPVPDIPPCVCVCVRVQKKDMICY